MAWDKCAGADRKSNKFKTGKIQNTKTEITKEELTVSDEKSRVLSMRGEGWLTKDKRK